VASYQIALALLYACEVIRQLNQIDPGSRSTEEQALHRHAI